MVFVLTSAPRSGISTAAGIPDFRSPDTGLYANLARLDLPHAEAVFDITYFRSNPLPFYTLAHELHPGRFRPTLSHCFIRLLSDKGLLLKLFTQNIDCLDLEAGVPASQIVEAHGSFADQHCIECKNAYPADMMKENIEAKSIPRCKICDGLVKPDIVFFGESLPAAFHQNRLLPSKADLCIVMGTSLTVQPFASLPDFCPKGIPRLLFNLVRVGTLGSRADDVTVIDECDSGVRRFASLLRWEKELDSLYKEMRAETAGKVAEPTLSSNPHTMTLDQEISRLTEEIDKALEISGRHVDKVLGGLMNEERKVTQNVEAVRETRIEKPHRADVSEKDAANGHPT